MKLIFHYGKYRIKWWSCNSCFIFEEKSCLVKGWRPQVQMNACVVDSKTCMWEVTSCNYCNWTTFTHVGGANVVSPCYEMFELLEDNKTACRHGNLLITSACLFKPTGVSAHLPWTEYTSGSAVTWVHCTGWVLVLTTWHRHLSSHPIWTEVTVSYRHASRRNVVKCITGNLQTGVVTLSVTYWRHFFQVYKTFTALQNE